MQTLTTDVVAPSERFSYWREVLTQHFIHLRPERTDGEPFSGRIEARELSGHSFSCVSSGHQRVIRGEPEIARSPHDLIFINLQLDGPSSYRQRGDERAVAPGDLFLIAAVEPFELGVEKPFCTMTLRLPRAWLNERLRRPAGASGAFMSRDSRVGVLLGNLMRVLWRGDFGATLPDGSQALEHLLALAAFAVEADSGRRRWPTAAAHAGIYACALRAIGRRCGDAELTPRGLAASLGVSLRALQAIFAANGDAIERRIQRARLERVAQLLADPAQRGRTIGELALAAGFNEQAHFTREFVRAYGLTPGAWRRAQSSSAPARDRQL
jgi:AraC family transcriptional activator of tynA and feaB